MATNTGVFSTVFWHSVRHLGTWFGFLGARTDKMGGEIAPKTEFCRIASRLLFGHS
jgi:hypothetical protein